MNQQKVYTDSKGVQFVLSDLATSENFFEDADFPRNSEGELITVDKYFGHDWEDDGKYQYTQDLIQIGDYYFGQDVSRSGSYFSEYYYDFDSPVYEVVAVEKTIIEYVRVK